MDAARAVLRAEVPLEDGADLVVVTSGSTGTGRGVLLPAAAVRASAAATLERLGGPGSWLLALPVSAIAGLQVLCRSEVAGREADALAWFHRTNAIDSEQLTDAAERAELLEKRNV